MSTPCTQYSLGLRVIHWLTVVAILGVAGASVGGKEDDIAASDVQSMQWHYVAGLAVFSLTVLRLILRIDMQAPPIVPAPSGPTIMTARLVHFALYLLLIAAPILGWLQLSYGGKQIVLPWLGWHVPVLVHTDLQVEEFAGELHELVGNIFYGVVGLHVLAALWHHFVRRDNTLKRML